MDVIINDEHLVNIADAIREKNGSEDTYTPGAMADAIRDIPQEGGGGGEEVNGIEFDITEVHAGTNREYDYLSAVNAEGQYIQSIMDYDDDGKCSQIGVNDLGSAEIEYDENGNLSSLSTRVYAGDAEPIAIDFFDFDQLEFEEPVSYPDFELNGTGLRQANEHSFMSEVYTIPDGATTMICDIDVHKYNNTTEACEVNGYICPCVVPSTSSGSNTIWGLVLEKLTSGADVRIDLSNYVKGATVDIPTVGEGTATGDFRFGVRNTKSGSVMTSTTFAFNMSVTNIRFE